MGLIWQVLHEARGPPPLPDPPHPLKGVEVGCIHRHLRRCTGAVYIYFPAGVALQTMEHAVALPVSLPARDAPHNTGEDPGSPVSIGADPIMKNFHGAT